MDGVYLPGPLVRVAGLGTGLVTGKVLDVFVLLSTGRLLAERGLPPPLTLVQIGEEVFPEQKDLGEGELPLGELLEAVGELMLIRTEEKQVLVADPLIGPDSDSGGIWKRYLTEGKEHPWVKNKSSFKGVLSSNLLNSPRLSPTSGESTPRISRGGGLYTIEKERDGERSEWRITPTLDSYLSGEDLARKMGLGLPKKSEDRGRFVGGIACLAVYALRAVPLPEEAFRDPEALSKAVVSEFKRTYGLVAEKLLEGTEEEVEEKVADLVLKVYPQESSQVGDG